MMLKESAVSFGRSTDLVGVVSAPAACGNDSRDRPAVILLNAGLVHRVGPHRMNVRLARGIAQAGFTTLRFDFSGIGDSPPRRDFLGIEEARRREISEAMTTLTRDHGMKRFVLAGLCTGADAAFRTSVDDPRVVGTLLIDAFPYRTLGWYRRHYGSRLFRWRSWRTLLRRPLLLWNQTIGNNLDSGSLGRNPPSRNESREGLEILLERGVHILCVLTAGMETHFNDPQQFRELFPNVDFGARIEICHLSESDHVFSRRRSQQQLTDRVCAWLRARYRRFASKAVSQSASHRELTPKVPT